MVTMVEWNAGGRGSYLAQSDPSSVRVFASENERYYTTPFHPTPQTRARARVRLRTRLARARVRLKTRAQVRPPCACAREPKNACAGEAQTMQGIVAQLARPRLKRARLRPVDFPDLGRQWS